MKKYIPLILAVLAVFASVSANEVGVKNRRANRLYDGGRYDEALKLYDEALAADPQDARLKMNRGSALYRLERFDEAEQSYLDALPDLSQRDENTLADAHYNLGNVQFRQGEQFESAGDAASARGRYSQALENYVSTLKARPNDNDAKWNLQLAHQKIELMRQMQQQQQQSDENEEGDQQQQQDDQGGKEGREQERNDEGEEQTESDGNEGEDENQDHGEEQSQERQPQEPQEEDARREGAQRLIEQFADDDEDLNKPRPQRGRVRQPEKDW